MPANGPSALRRGALGGLSLLLVALAAALAATSVAGSRIWPADEDVPARRIGTAADAIEAAVAAGDPSAPLRIGVVGDIQNGISELADLLDAFRADRVDFILQLGDAANVGLPARYAVLRHLFEEHAPGIPVIAVPGNHDIEPDETTTEWAAWVGPPQWRLDVRGWRILGLDDADGRIAPESVALLEAAAKEPPPRGGAILVAHRPLGAAEPSDGMDVRSRQIEASGLVPTMTLSGHWHRNDRFTDARGTLHVLLGENCDRTSAGGDLPVSHAVLTLAAGHDLAVTPLPRRRTLRGEFLRTAIASVYPVLRGRAALVWVVVAGATLVALLFARGALRRANPPGA